MAEITFKVPDDALVRIKKALIAQYEGGEKLAFTTNAAALKELKKMITNYLINFVSQYEQRVARQEALKNLTVPDFKIT